MKRLKCRRCGAEHTITRHKAGSVVGEAALWVLLVLPGFLYHLWRHKHNYYQCQDCGYSAKTSFGIAK